MLGNEERQQLDARIEGIGKFFDRNVCDNMKIYIFGGIKTSKYVNTVIDYPNYINRILSLAFVFAHGCLRCDNDSENPVNKNASKQSSLRIINSLRKAYTQYPATSELIQFALSDIQFEMLQGPDGELYEIFEKLCTFSVKGFNLTQYYKVISEWKAAPARFNMNSNELAGLFQKLLQSMEFLRNYNLECEDGEFFFVEKEAMDFGDYGKYSRISANHLIYYNPVEVGRDMYSLYSVERVVDRGQKTLVVRYVAGKGFKTISLTVGEKSPEADDQNVLHICTDAEDFYYEIVGEEWDFDKDEQAVKKNSNFIDQVHAINYKYIKNLALAISDTISVNVGSKKALYDAYHVRHKDLFEKISSPEEIENITMDWDSIIVMLLIEASPTSVLETLFRKVPQTFISIANNLCKRIGNPDMPIYGLSKTELLDKVNEVIKTKLIFGESSGFGKIPRARENDGLFARAASLLIISSLSTVLETDDIEKTICAGNIYDNIVLLTKMKDGVDVDQRCKYVSIILGETFRHLICFYTALLEYGEIKGKFDAEACNSFFSEQKIASYQKKMHSAFMKTAKETAEDLKKYNSAEYKDMLELLNRFISLCELCGASARNSSLYAHKLYSAIGRHDILNVSEFKKLAMGCVNSFSDINEKNVDAWISFALDILRYLCNGTTKGSGEVSIRAIYPFTATYNRGNENYDGYKTVTFALNIDVDNYGEEHKEYINVLTEFTYKLSTVLYCLPNMLRSNRKWWIDPVLIDFKAFNEIFENDN